MKTMLFYFAEYLKFQINNNYEITMKLYSFVKLNLGTYIAI